MRLVVSKHSQRGMTLLVGMVMLVLITMMVTTAFTMSTSNLKSVGNMQAHDQAIAAANVALEQALEELTPPFTTPLEKKFINVDHNNDGTTDYEVTITPDCVRATPETSPLKSDTDNPSLSDFKQWNVMLNVRAEATDATDAKTGANTTVNAGMRVSLTDVEKKAVCPE